MAIGSWRMRDGSEAFRMVHVATTSMATTPPRSAGPRVGPDHLPHPMHDSTRAVRKCNHMAKEPHEAHSRAQEVRWPPRQLRADPNHPGRTPRRRPVHRDGETSGDQSRPKGECHREWPPLSGSPLRSRSRGGRGLSRRESGGMGGRGSNWCRASSLMREHALASASSRNHANSARTSTTMRNATAGRNMLLTGHPLEHPAHPGTFTFRGRSGEIPELHMACRDRPLHGDGATPVYLP